MQIFTYLTPLSSILLPETLIGRREYLKGLSPLGKPENNPLPPAPPRAYSYLESNFDFTPEEPIGQGGYGKVFKTTFKADKKIYALKYFGMMEYEFQILKIFPMKIFAYECNHFFNSSGKMKTANPPFYKCSPHTQT